LYHNETSKKHYYHYSLPRLGKDIDIIYTSLSIWRGFFFENRLTKKIKQMYYNDETQVFFNGEWLKAKDLMVSPYVQTMHYGSGVFEGIRSYETPDGTRVFKSLEHYERLLHSAKMMHLNVNYTAQEFTDLTYQLLEKNNLSNAYIRPLIFAGANMSSNSNRRGPCNALCLGVGKIP
jgi:branched-chain amino acid aminotransferase